MKSLKIAIAIFVVCLGVSIWALFQLHHYQDTLSASIESAIDCAKKGDIEKAKEEVERFYEMWEEYDPTLTAIVRHHTIDDIEKTAAGLLPLLDAPDLSIFYSEARRTLSLIEVMWKDERVSVENLF